MRYVIRCFLLLPALAGAAILLMGADAQVKSSATNSVASAMTGSAASSSISRATGSMAGGTANTPISSMSSSAPVSVVNRVTATAVTLSPYAEELAKIINFDRRVLLLVKEETQDRIGRLVGFDEDGYQIIASGIVVSVPEDQTDRVLASLRRKLRPLKYMPFVVEMNEGLKIEKIGVLKGTNQYDILRVMQTNGDDYDISNQDVIDWLKECEVHSSFDIIGADNDWVEIEFNRLPKDLEDFAEEVYDFSPDTVDQGPGSIEGLVRDIKTTNRLFLWWD
jgi:hypothetical protein